MTNCEKCRDRLLDHVYGLLEGVDAHAVREHLNVCSDCQADLEQVRAEQKLFACAAKAVTEIPEFRLPSNEPAIIPMTTLPGQAPADHAAGSPKKFWRRPWVAWTAAAALLIAVSGSFSFYRHTLDGYEVALSQKREEHKRVVESFVSLPATYQAKQHAAIQEVRMAAGPYLHVVGPTTLQPGAKGHLHIKAHHPEGTPREVRSKNDFARIDLRIKVVDVEANQVKAMNLKCDDHGQATAELDASFARPNSVLQVIVEARTGLGQARIEEKVRILTPTYVTRLDTNKIAYQFNDVLFFRVLVLDRTTMQPPTEPIPMRVELMNPQGEAVRSLDMLTGAGGTLGREFAIDNKFREGNYSLNVRPLDPTKTQVQAVSQGLEIVRKLLMPEFKFDQDHYHAGDKARIFYHGQQPLPKQAIVNGLPVPVTSDRDAAGMGGGVAKVFGKGAPAEAGDGIQSFQIPIPSNLPSGTSRVPMTLQFADGKKKTADIPLAPTNFTIDFFPEGGELIAGVPNRVFYRVQSGSGRPVVGHGQVMLLTAGKDEIVDSTYHLGMGYLDFVPHPKEVYTARITTPTKIENVKAPFANLGIRSEGVVIQVADLGADRAPKAVGNQGDPIRLTLRQQGPSRKLLLLAQCRGQIVDQRWVDLGRDAVEVTLNPTQEAVGMIRVTAYELADSPAKNQRAGAVLQPVAERLVYRTATQRLDLGLTLNRQQLLPGPVVGKVSARDEKGLPAQAWLLASITDERFQARPRSLSAHFFLLNEIRTGADLDDAQVLLHDSPEALQVLERFLGTHGWRRFIRTEEPGIAPAIFSREAVPAVVLQKQYQENLAKVLTPLRTAGFSEQHDLEDERLALAAAVEVAARDLSAFEDNVQASIRIALRLLLVALLLVSLVLMGIGLYRIVGDRQRATPAFGSAFACLAACISLFFLGNWLGPINVLTSGVVAQGAPAKEILQKLEEQFALAPAARQAASKPILGAFPLPASKKYEQENKIAGRGLAQDANDQLARAMGRRTLGEGAFSVKADRKSEEQQFRAVNSAMNNRFNDAMPIGNPAAKAMGPHPLAGKPPTLPNENKRMLEGAGREYAHQHADVLADTLLWHPNLWLADGNAEIRFDIGGGNVTYRVLLLGHNATGRFGFYETRLDVLGR